MSWNSNKILFFLETNFSSCSFPSTTQRNKMRLSKLVILPVPMIFFIFLIGKSIYLPTRQKFGRSSNDEIIREVDETNDVVGVCILPNYDYFHPSIMNVSQKEEKKCDRNYKPMTVLENGEWKIVKKGANCSARCIESKGNKEIDIKEWMQPGPVNCEILEAVCFKGGVQTYGRMHTQIIPKAVGAKSDAPNVFIFVLDSTSFGMAKRSLPSTLSHLSHQMQSVEFPFLNRVGENSQINFYSLVFGKIFEDIINGSDESKTDWSFAEYKHRFLDKEPHLFKDFRDAGYVTMHAEDTRNYAIDTYAVCNGFKNVQVDHLMRPFQHHMASTCTDVTKSHLDGKFCETPPHAVLDYFQKFVDSYKDKPKFSLTWFSEPAHDNLADLQDYDDLFTEFFKKNQELFDNSFVFFIGDHGFRRFTSAMYNIPLMWHERNNPLLVLTVPKKQRDERVMDVLRENSKHLQTHFDTRATILDILKYQPLSNFTDHRSIYTPSERGYSYLREQPIQSRNCEALGISRTFCICQVESFNVADTKLRNRLGRKVVDKVNDKIKRLNMASICEPHEMDEVTDLFRDDDTNTYKITVKAKAPSNALIQTYLVHDTLKDDVRLGVVTRLDNFGGTTRCTDDIKSEFLCHCK